MTLISILRKAGLGVVETVSRHRNCELASAASVAGLLQLHAAGDLPRSGVAVCVLTGNGLKDPDWAIAGAPPPRQVGPHVDEVAEAIGF